jgi:hypothetical protein
LDKNLSIIDNLVKFHLDKNYRREFKKYTISRDYFNIFNPEYKNIQNNEFKDIYECTISGYQQSKDIILQLSREFVNKHGAHTKFLCQEQSTI